ncbi:hypothetical conserved protein [Candidatus Nitrosoglobus terrae]|uniref:Hypothetical conserved protein n=1 Tax=Candidatus Nitrosoglobus terrae TaxID=1630141 RepID=A0A1Q2SLY6_9GAMM|nr:hypothetical conserved protein [Candidatus Nitrosoglobus terrae]
MLVVLKFIQFKESAKMANSLTEYTIYLVNKNSSGKNFWLFLERPEELAADEKVFANSSV